MKFLSIVKLTIAESLLGPLFWISFTTGTLLVASAALLSGAALSHTGRLLDVSSYFVIDLLVFAVACFQGSSLYSRNFSTRGLSEIAIPMGFSRESLITSRLLGESLSLVGITGLLYAFRFFAFFIVDENLTGLLQPSLQMALFTSLKAILACVCAAFLGSLTRPVIATLGTFAFFFLGHYSSGITGLRGLVENANPLVSPFLTFLLRIFKVWNPNHLVLESFAGEWEKITSSALLWRGSWGILAIAVATSAAVLIIRNRSIESASA